MKLKFLVVLAAAGTLSVTAILAIVLVSVSCLAGSQVPLPPPSNSGDVAGSQHLQVVKRLQTKGFINAVAWNADGTRLAALSLYGSTITIWETKNWTVVKEFERCSGPYSNNSLAFLPDGSLVTSAPVGTDCSKDPRSAETDRKYGVLSMFSVIQWNPDTGKPVRYYPEMPYPPPDRTVRAANTFAASKDGAFIGAISGRDVLLYETHGATLVRTLKTPSLPAHPELWTESYRKQVAAHPPTSFPDYAKSLAFSPDGKELAVGTLSGMVNFFTLKDGALRYSFAAYPFTSSLCVRAIAYSPDGQSIATGKARIVNLSKNDNITTNVWRVGDGAKLAALEGEVSTIQGVDMPDRINTIAWSPEGGALAAGGSASLRVWRVAASGDQLLYLQKQGNNYSLAYSRQSALAVSTDNQITIYSSVP
jgi:WD40 repeat protein